MEWTACLGAPSCFCASGSALSSVAAASAHVMCVSCQNQMSSKIRMPLETGDVCDHGVRFAHTHRKCVDGFGSRTGLVTQSSRLCTGWCNQTGSSLRRTISHRLDCVSRGPVVLLRFGQCPFESRRRECACDVRIVSKSDVIHNSDATRDWPARWAGCSGDAGPHLLKARIWHNLIRTPRIGKFQFLHAVITSAEST